MATGSDTNLPDNVEQSIILRVRDVGPDPEALPSEFVVYHDPEGRVLQVNMNGVVVERYQHVTVQDASEIPPAVVIS